MVVCKRLCGGGLQHFSVSPSPLVTFWVSKLIGSWLGLGLGGFGTKGLGTGLDNSTFSEDIFMKLLPHKLYFLLCQLDMPKTKQETAAGGRLKLIQSSVKKE